MKKADRLICLLAVLGIIFLEGFALHKGVDGTCFGLAIAAIAGIAGFKLSDLLRRQNG